MADLSNLPNALDEGQALEPVTLSEAQSDSDAVALKIVLQDAQTAENYLNSKGLPSEWNTNQDLYRAYVRNRTWPGTDVQRSNIGMPLIMEVIEDVLPQAYMAFFSEPQPFALLPKGKTTEDAARAAAKIICWAIKKSGFKEEFRLHMKSDLLHGFAVSRPGYEIKKVKKKHYQRQAPPVATGEGQLGISSIPTEASETVTAEPQDVEIVCPTFENFELQNVLIDAACRRQDCRTGKVVIFQHYLSVEEVADLADQPGYKNIPSLEELRKLQVVQNAPPAKDSLASIRQESYRENQAQKQATQQQADPGNRPIEVLEAVYEDRVIAVLERCIVIRNEDNEFEHINALSSAFIDVLGSAYGLGITKLLAGEQMFQQGVLNSWVDALALALNPMFQRNEGLNNGTQQIVMGPGKVYNGPKLEQLIVSANTAEALNALQSSEARAQRRIGLDASDIPTQAFRTGTGVQQLTASVANKLQYWIEQLADLVFIPALEHFLQVCKDHMTPAQMQAILTEEEGQAFQGNIMDIYNGDYAFEVLSSTKLAARKAASQLLPLFIQLLTAAPVQDSLVTQNMKVNYASMMKDAMDLTGFPTDAYIQPMTPEDQQRAQQQAMGPAMMQQQAKQQDQSDKLEQIEAKGQATAANSVVRTLLKSVENNQALAKNIGPMLGGGE